MQNIAKRCIGNTIAKRPPTKPKLGSGFENKVLVEKKKKDKKTIMYTIGIKKNTLNFLTFIETFSGTFFCNPIAIAQNHPKKIAKKTIIIKGKNLK